MSERKSTPSRPSPELRARMREAQDAALQEVRDLELSGLMGLVVTRDRHGDPYVRLNLSAFDTDGGEVPERLGGLPVRVQRIGRVVTE